MTIKENEKLRKLIDEWNSYYQIDDDSPEKTKAVNDLLDFVDSLSEEPKLCKKDWDTINNARLYKFMYL